MLAKLASTILGLKSSGGDQKEATDTDSTELSSQEHFISFPITLFKIDGNDVELLRPRAIVAFKPSDLEIWTETLDELEYRIPYMQVCAVRQHRPITTQFLWRQSADESDEIGMQFSSAESAFEFREELLGALVETCVPLISSRVWVALFEPETKTFRPWVEQALMNLSRRENDGLATLTLIKDLEVIFQSELSRDIQLWQTPDLKQFTMLGPYIKKDAEELVRSLFLFRIEEDSNATLEFFRILEKLVGYEEKLIRNDAYEMLDSEQDNSESGSGEAAWSTDDTQGDDRDWYYETSSLGKDLSDNEENERPSPKPVKPKRSSIINDPSELIIEKDPAAKLHRFMQVGENHSLVCRATDVGNESLHFKDSKKIDFDLHVYGRERNEKLADLTTITGDKFKYAKKQVRPAKGLLHNQEGKLLMLDETDKDAIYYMDIEREKIVSKFDTDGMQASILFPTFKSGSRSQDPTFTCANSRAMYLMDTRKPKSRAHTLEYKTNPQFTAAATDESGHIVLGNRTGTLRLYDGEPNPEGKYKIAKTQLDTFKEPIKHVDVTKDGSWILATTKNCLVLFNTKLKATGKTGFETRLGQNKPSAIYLRLSDKDVQKYGLTNIEFASAVFDNANENILTSTGNLAIIWDFKQIRRGQWPVEAKIKLTDAYIKDTKAMHDGSVVVAYPQDLDVLGVRRR